MTREQKLYTYYKSDCNGYKSQDEKKESLKDSPHTPLQSDFRFSVSTSYYSIRRSRPFYHTHLSSNAGGSPARDSILRDRRCATARRGRGRTGSDPLLPAPADNTQGGGKEECDVVLQKTYIENHLTHRQIRNRGDLPRFRVTDAHDAIVDRHIFEQAQKITAMRRVKDGNSAYPYGDMLRCPQSAHDMDVRT